jgi:hypothetical protein
MAVQEDVDLLRRLRRRNVDEPETDAIALQIDEQRPIRFGVAIAAHEGDGRADIFQPNEQTGRAEIAQVPDLIDVVRQRLKVFWKTIMRVGEDKDSQGFGVHLAGILIEP